LGQRWVPNCARVTTFDYPDARNALPTGYWNRPPTRAQCRLPCAGRWPPYALDGAWVARGVRAGQAAAPRAANDGGMETASPGWRAWIA